jgi:hypothetical protein
MAAIILAAVFVVFFGQTFVAWRRYLWVADVLGDRHLAKVQR